MGVVACWNLIFFFLIKYIKSHFEKNEEKFESEIKNSNFLLSRAQDTFFRVRSWALMCLQLSVDLGEMFNQGCFVKIFLANNPLPQQQPSAKYIFAFPYHLEHFRMKHLQDNYLIGDFAKSCVQSLSFHA